MGESKNLKLDILDGSPNFELRLTIWSGSQEKAHVEYVDVDCSEPCIESHEFLRGK